MSTLEHEKVPFPLSKAECHG